MKENVFLNGVTSIDPDIVERFISMDNKLQKKVNKSKTKAIWLRLGAIAACFALIVGTILIVPMFREDKPSGPPIADTGTSSDSSIDTLPPSQEETDVFTNSDTTDIPSQGEETDLFPNPDTTDVPSIITPPDNAPPPIIFDATVSPDKLNGNNSEFIVGSSLSISGGSADSAPPRFQFDKCITVKARVVKNHPDKYHKLDVSSEYSPTPYRLIQMETIDIIYGENVPKYFLYLIRDYVYVDMSVYDSLLISMYQQGVENYVLKNATQNQMESFELPLFRDYQDHPELGNIIAFTDGVFDESLWQNENWIYGYQFARHMLDNPEDSDLVVARGDSESDVISKIKKQFSGYNFIAPYTHCVSTLDFKTQAAKDVLEYVKPFVNGVFSQTYSANRRILFRRFINGCQTEETISIDLHTEEVTYSKTRYTKDDMAKMVNISAHLSEKAKEYAEKLPIPPYTDPEGKTLLCLNLYAWYAKVDGKLYGVIKTAWRYMEEGDYYVQYYDDNYVLYDMSSESAAEISRDDLIELLGERNVYTGEYGLGILMPMY